MNTGNTTALRDTLIATGIAFSAALLLPQLAAAPWLSILLLQAGFVLIPFLFRYNPDTEDNGLLRRPSLRDLVLTGVITLCLAPILTLVGSLTGPLFPGFEEHTLRMNRLLLPGGLGIGEIPLFLMLALLPALGEEFLFRGFLLGRLRRHFSGPLGAITVSALLFSLIHLDLYRAIPLFLYGAVLALLTTATGSLWPAVFSHLVNNSVALLSLRLLPADPAKGLPIAPSPLAVLLILVPTVIAFTLLTHLIRNHRR